jgi:hypothetical protein
MPTHYDFLENDCFIQEEVLMKLQGQFMQKYRLSSHMAAQIATDIVEMIDSIEADVFTLNNII